MPWHRRHHRGREAAIAIAFVIGGAVLLIFFISLLHNAKSQTLGPAAAAAGRALPSSASPAPVIE
jgi:hypothetical protein